MEELAVKTNPRAIEFIDNPTEELMKEAVLAGWSNLNYIKKPSYDVLKLAIEQRGWAIQYVKEPIEELQIMAVKKDYDSIKYIKEPSETVQVEAVKVKYDALRYIKNPCFKAEITAVKNNEAAINFIYNLDAAKLKEFFKANVLVIKYIVRKIEKDDVIEVLKEVLSKDDVDEKYVRDFLKCNSIDKYSDKIDIDKILFIYKYGSKKAKKIAVDEKLRTI